MGIALAEKFQPILDEIFMRESVTNMLDSRTRSLDHSDANKIHIYKTTLVGLGSYDKAQGFPPGDVVGAWEEIQLTKDRGRAFSIDAMDNEETIGMAFGTLVGEFMRTHVVPEVDAYRFSQFFAASGISKVGAGATLTSNTVLAAIDVATAQLDEDQVPMEGRILYVSSSVGRMLDAAITRSLSTERGVDRRLQRLDEMEIVRVPQSRFYTQVTLDIGSSSGAGGYAKTSSTGKDLNFLLVHPSAIWQAKKHAPLRIFSPEENQTADAWLIQYRLYHDAGVYDNKVDGVYAHMKA